STKRKSCSRKWRAKGCGRPSRAALSPTSSGPTPAGAAWSASSRKRPTISTPSSTSWNMAKQPIRAYGDLKDDGRIQLSFTLPLAASARAKEAGKRFCEALGLRNVFIATCEPAGREFSFYVAYANADVTLDFAEVE